MVDTAGTLCSAADILMQKGAKEVYACCSHGVLSGPAIERINASQIQQLVITDSVPLRDNALACEKIKVLSVAKLFGNAISCIHSEDSVSSLFV
jgi:ribose-phosphate pyrophosphokinase